MKALVIAIDGPAGAGKSTVSKLIANRLNLRYLDTGAMYRCVALRAQHEGVSADDGMGIAAVAAKCDIRFEAGSPQRVLLNGEDVTEAIRTLEIGELASALSIHSEVRRILVSQQQAFIAEGGYVLEGRDATTVIAPNADVKVFLTASLDERARRRALELESKGQVSDHEQVKEAVAARDHRDTTRADSPLQKSPDAVLIDSFGLTPDQVVDEILRHLPVNACKPAPVAEN